MPFTVGFLPWSTFSLPSGLSTSDLENDIDVSSDWYGEPFTYNGGGQTFIEIDDDDGDFEDAYVEAGGAQTLTSALNIGGVTYAAGSVVENEFTLIDSGGLEVIVVRIDGVNVGLAFPDGQGPTVGQSFTASSSNNCTSADTAYTVLACFTPDVRIETEQGACPAEHLRVGQWVLTKDAGLQQVRWVSRRHVTFQPGDDQARPVLLKCGATGENGPQRDMVVSPHHRFLMHDPMHGPSGEVIVPAKAMTKLPGVREMRGKRRVTYVHFALETHQLVRAEGLWTESCFLGPMLIDGMPISERCALGRRFPWLNLANGAGYGPTARPVMTVQSARRRITEQSLAWGAAPSLDAFVSSAPPRISPATFPAVHR